jgi:predicted O-methyltransferase YrrM
MDDKTTKDWWIFKPDNTSKINRPSLRTLENKKDLVGIEIGVANGRNAHNILTNLDVKKLYLIDPFENYDHFQKVKWWKELAMELLAPFSDRIVWIEKPSKLAIDDIKEQVDFVYIDGNHKSEFVREDIELYYPIVKDGGLVSGHDVEVSLVNNVIKERFPHTNIGRCNDSGSWDWWVTKSTATESTFINDILQQDTETLNKLME